MKKKGLFTLILTAGLALSASFTSFAEWQQEGPIWKFSQDGVYLTGWHWLDGNQDGISECYYFYENGVMAASTLAEGYTVNAEGQWTVDGVVQTKTAEVLAEGEIAGIDRTKGNGFIKQELMDCLGRNKAYVDGRLGQPLRETKSENADYPYDLTVDYASNSEANIWVDYKNNIATRIFSYTANICNMGTEKWPTEKVDKTLGVTHYTTQPDTIQYLVWELQESPKVTLTYNWFVSVFELEVTQ